MSDNDLSRDGDSNDGDAMSRVPATDIDQETMETLRQQVFSFFVATTILVNIHFDFDQDCYKLNHREFVDVNVFFHCVLYDAVDYKFDTHGFDKEVFQANKIRFET